MAHVLEGPRPRPAAVRHPTRLCLGGGGHAGAGHRRQHGDLQHRQRAGDEAVAVQSTRPLGWILATGPTRAGPRRRLPARVRRVSRRGHGLLPSWLPGAARLGDPARRRRRRAVVAQAVIGDLQVAVGPARRPGPTLRAATRRPARRGSSSSATGSGRARFGARRHLGRDVFVDGQPHTIVGVLTPEIELGNKSEIDLWLPTGPTTRAGRRTERGWRPVGRCADGATMAEANAQVAAIAARLAARVS